MCFCAGEYSVFGDGAQYGARKTFTDYIDDVSTTYPGPNINGAWPIKMSQISQEMSDPSGTHVKDDSRGNSEKKDWYSFAGITLSFKLNNDTKGCYP